MFSILTQTAAENIAFSHNRTPVILPVEAKYDWLNMHYSAGDVLEMAATNVNYKVQY